MSIHRCASKHRKMPFYARKPKRLLKRRDLNRCFFSYWTDDMQLRLQHLLYNYCLWPVVSCTSGPWIKKKVETKCELCILPTRKVWIFCIVPIDCTAESVGMHMTIRKMQLPAVYLIQGKFSEYFSTHLKQVSLKISCHIPVNGLLFMYPSVIVVLT